MREREHAEQAALVRRAEWHAGRYPILRLLYAIPNGGARSAAVAGRLKAEGVRAGVPDLCLPVPSADGRHIGLYLELKAPGGGGERKGRTSDAQEGWIAALRAAGHRVEVCYGQDAAWAVLAEHVGISAES